MTAYKLAVSTWDDQELTAIREVCDSGDFTMGRRVAAFEKEFAAYFGSRYAVMVNSGSSANLAAATALMYRKTGALNPGDEVLVPAVSWSTSYYPFTQNGLRLRFVDIDASTLNIDLDAVEDAITPATRAILAVNLLGNPVQLTKLRSICERRGLTLVEDNCESMGARCDGRYTGTFGVCGTFSMFFSHHICTMEGGMVVTDDEELYQLMLSLRAHGWVRGLPEKNHVWPKSGDPFEDAYRFVLPGYNLRPLEMSGAIGSVQLRKLDGFLEGRRRNAAHFTKVMAAIPGLRLQQMSEGSSWFAFAMTLEGALAGRRAGLAQALQAAQIECRPIVAGNFTKNPVMKHLEHSIHRSLKVADKIHVDGLYVGNHHIDLATQIDRLAEVVSGFASKGR